MLGLHRQTSSGVGKFIGRPPAIAEQDLCTARMHQQARTYAHEAGSHISEHSETPTYYGGDRVHLQQLTQQTCEWERPPITVSLLGSPSTSDSASAARD